MEPTAKFLTPFLHVNNHFGFFFQRLDLLFLFSWFCLFVHSFCLLFTLLLKIKCFPSPDFEVWLGFSNSVNLQLVLFVKDRNSQKKLFGQVEHVIFPARVKRESRLKRHLETTTSDNEYDESVCANGKLLPSLLSPRLTNHSVFHRHYRQDYPVASEASTLYYLQRKWSPSSSSTSFLFRVYRVISSPVFNHYISCDHYIFRDSLYFMIIVLSTGTKWVCYTLFCKFESTIQNQPKKVCWRSQLQC